MSMTKVSTYLSNRTVHFLSNLMWNQENYVEVSKTFREMKDRTVL